MGKFDDNLQALVDAGSLTEAQANELRDASPLKAERDDARAQAEANATRARALEEKIGSEVFTKLGIDGVPSAYNLPSDVDITNEDQVAAWARTMNLIAPAGPSPEEQAAHERMQQATSGATPPVPVAAGDKVANLRKQILRAGPDQLAPGSPLYEQTLDALTDAGHTFGDVPHSTNFERIPDWGSTKVNA